MRKNALIIITLCALASGARTAAESHVYVLHGFGSNRWVMNSLTRRLEQNGYQVTNWGYSSFTRSLPELGGMLYSEIVNRDDITSVSFVTHSMGGLVVRAMSSYADEDADFPRIDRVVMLSPPNHGAQIADFFSRSKFLCWALGPNLADMRTDSASLANRLPDLDGIELGIVMGGRFDQHGWNPFIKGDDDGFLTRDKARLGTEEDFVSVPENHFFMPHNKQSQEYILRFLKTGSFDPPASAGSSSEAEQDEVS